MERPRKYNKNKGLPRNFYGYRDLCRIEGIDAKRMEAAVKHQGVEGIKKLEELEPIEHLFEVFETPIKGGMTQTFGILRRYYDDWKRDGRVPVRPPGRPKKKGVTILKATVPEKLKDEFQAVVDKANSMSAVHVTYSDMVAVAIQEFIGRRPQFLPEFYDEGGESDEE